ncbi:MAG: MOSC domain-containing protein [Marivita sp.]|uniref:MOSC domain-containing protein n=1 Tax=Marivita sp. TaxID=2003365 RepID=UPI0025C3FBF4|nr:MOSC N-terminal beta barrel domain-containing protein [Marivita sp.]MCI5109985.1 MOSC domain-containing protein [Marivita sp.]
MTATVTEIWRHPIKSHGREALDSVTVAAGGTVPFDRVWAVAHERSKADGSEWVSCGHFCRVAKLPSLMAITARFDEAQSRITLSHPDLPDLTFDPDGDSMAFLDWAQTLVLEDALRPARLIKARAQAFTDSDFPSVTLCNHASHRAVEQRVGQPLSHLRWRGNIWIDGLAPWEEFDWEGREVRIGEAVLRVRERTDRCKSTHSNPATGKRDVDVLSALDSWGHQDFSVRAEVIQGGAIKTGDEVARV